MLMLYRFKLEFKENGTTHLCGDIIVRYTVIAESEEQANNALILFVAEKYERRVTLRDQITTTLETKTPIAIPHIFKDGDVSSCGTFQIF